jgi:Xaa-Pro aminopeptidase
MPKSEYASRRARLGAEFGRHKLDAMIVSASVNIRYLSGFTGSNGLLLAAADCAVLFTDPRYGTQASQETDCRVRVVKGPLHSALLKEATRRGFRRVGFEPSRVPWGVWSLLNENMPLGGTLYPAPGIVDALRIVKSASEIAAIRRSVLTNSAAYARAMRAFRAGMTETALAASIEYQMRLLGAEKPAFETIVASGAHSALPHASPREEPIKPGRFVLVDMGCFQDGYASDMTRVAFTGAPPPKARRLYRAVLEAQLAAIDAVRPGVAAGRVDSAARRVLRAHGYGRVFVHSTGHGLGLEIHEAPRLGKGEKTPLEAGMAITIEPGAYLPGYGGVRIEDTVLVTSTGCEILTPTPKDLLEL